MGWKGRDDKGQEEIVKESKTTFRTEPMEPVNWESEAEGGGKESEFVWHVGNSKVSKSDDQRHKTCRGQREIESTMHTSYLYLYIIICTFLDFPEETRMTLKGWSVP